MRDPERRQRNVQALRDEGLDAVVATFPHNVLLLSGYWPVLGQSVAILTREGQVLLLVPEDEQELANQGGPDNVLTFAAGSLTDLSSTAQIVQRTLSKAATDLGLSGNSILGYEEDEAVVPVPYAALHLFGACISDLLQAAFPHATVRGASNFLERMRAVLTPGELEQVRSACKIAQNAFLEGESQVSAGMREPEVANAFRQHLNARGIDRNQTATRAEGWAWCMSGSNSAKAAAAFARTRDRKLQKGDLILIHSNSHVNGFWTDITRTFCLGQPDPRHTAMYLAVLKAFETALAAIKPGAQACLVDQAARQTLREHGFEKQFKHGTGHGVGFAAISYNARPRLHPVSPDLLELGMVFNVEPAIYIEDYGGLRHCSMVAVTNAGAELLTPFQSNMESLVLGSAT